MIVSKVMMNRTRANLYGDELPMSFYLNTIAKSVMMADSLLKKQLQGKDRLVL